MKNLIFVAVFASLFVFMNLEAKDFSNVEQELISNNLLKGLSSENDGLRVSSAYRIFQMIETEKFVKAHFSNAVQPLTKMLREGKTEYEKLVAALSLYTISDKRGIYFLGYMSVHNESERIRKVCQHLYISHYMKNI